MEQRKVTGRTRDYATAWLDDRFEIFIVPDESKLYDGRQFIITSGGVLWDSCWREVNKFDASWNSNAVYRQVDGEDAWRGELIIPFADFGFETVPEKPFRINIYRFRNVNGEPESGMALAPIRRGINFQPERFGKITWEE